MAYKITLDSFQGPLDLLLHLIEKNKVDIYDIPISQITDQYMNYINTWKVLNLDIASEFLVMAATLLEIKSKLLLPNDEEKEKQLMMEEADPRQELIEKLLEYKKYKMISTYLKDLEKREEKIVYKDPEYFPEFQNMKVPIKIEEDLIYKAFKNILLKKCTVKNQNTIIHEIEKDTYSIEDKTHEILRLVEQLNTVRFSKLFDNCYTKNELVTIFLALLELIKMRKIVINQKELFDDFFIIKYQENDSEIKKVY